MKCGARVALGVAGGYFLGRTKKMRLALMLGGMMAGRRTGGPGELLAQGGKLMSRSPELTKLVEDVRGQLFEAGKGAALAVATRQVESLADRVSGLPVSRVKDTVAETKDSVAGTDDGEAEERPDRAGERATGRAGGAATRARSAGGGAGTRARGAGSARGSGRASTATRSTRTARRREGNDD